MASTKNAYAVNRSHAPPFGAPGCSRVSRWRAALLGLALIALAGPALGAGPVLSANPEAGSNPEPGAAASPSPAENPGAAAKSPAKVTYIAAEGIYVDAGRNSGLAVGDTLQVMREGAVVARVVVTHVSSLSCACRVLDEGAEIRTGDQIAKMGRLVTISVGTDPPRQTAYVPARKTRSARRMENRLRGYVAFQTLVQKDLAGEGLTSWQPGISAKIVVRNLFGGGADFRIRHRSRFYHRSNAPDDVSSADEWSHRLSELAIVFDDPRSRYRWGIGRVVTARLNGIGYIDGAYGEIQLNQRTWIGLAAGTEPDYQGSGFQADRLKLGSFLSYEFGDLNRRRLRTTLSLAGSYAEGMVSREFIALQNNLRLGKKLSVYQSMEVDYNRAWRFERANERLALTNFYLIGNYDPTGWMSLNLTYDSRKNVRTFQTYDTPDSLFDDMAHQGVSGGVRLRLPRDLRLKLYGGVRHREGENNDNRYGSAAVTAQRFPAPGHSVTGSLSYSESFFSKAYRPLLTYQAPVLGFSRLRLSAGGYLYETFGIMSSSYFGDIEIYNTVGRRFFYSLNAREYFGGDLESVQGFIEAGVSF